MIILVETKSSEITPILLSYFKVQCSLLVSSARSQKAGSNQRLYAGVYLNSLTISTKIT